MNRTQAIIKGLAALAATGILALGIPMALVRYVGWPLPDRIPTVDEISLALRSGVDPRLLINILAVVVWVAWAQLVIALAVEATAAVRGRTARRAPILPGLQSAASRLVATITLAVATFAPVRPAVAIPEPPPVVAVQEEDRVQIYSIQDPAAVDQDHVQTSSREQLSAGYQVRRFDTFWTIAENTLGDGRRWKEIRDLNIGQPTARGTTITATTEDVPAGTSLTLPSGAAVSTSTDEPSGMEEVTVDPGDSFWSIAQQNLADAWNRQPSDTEITDYWKRLVDANRDRLQPPYDPDLIYPGQVFHLPATPEDPSLEVFESGSGSGLEVTVEEGESFWTIAERSLVDALGRQPSDAETTAYWKSLVDANRDRLQPPYDPDLIYPSQVFHLPPIPADATAQGADTGPRVEEPTSVAEPPAARPDAAAEESEDEDRVESEVDELAVQPTTDNIAGQSETDSPEPPATSVAEPPGAEDTASATVTRPAAFEADPDEQDTPLLPVAGGLAGLGLLAAGTVAVVNRLRRVQLRQRRPGTIPTPPPATTTTTENILRAAAAPTAADLISLSLRGLARQITDNHIPPPQVVGAHLGDELLRLLLWTPHHDPPSGWQVDDDGYSWTLPTTIDPTHLHFQADTFPAPYPTMVTVGHDDGGQLLLDLEHLGAAQITGEPDQVTAVCHTMAIELATSEIADMVDVVCVGFGGDLVHLERIIAVDDVGDILAEVDRKTAALDRTDATPLEGRMAPGGDTWTPIVVFDPRADKPENVDWLLAAAHRGRAICAIVGYPTGGQWRLHIADGNITVRPLGFSYHRRDLTPTETTGIADLTSAAKDLEGVPQALAAPTHLGTAATDVDRDESAAGHVEVTPNAGSSVELRTLGPVGIDGIDREFPEGKCLELVAYLVLHRRGVEPDNLMEALYPGQPPKTHRLNDLVHRARRTLGDTPDGDPYIPYFYGTDPYQINPQLGCDLERFTAHIDTAEKAPDSDKLPHLQAALDIVEGPPFGARRGYGWAHSEGISTHAIVAIDNTAHQLAQLALQADQPELTTWAARKGLTVTWACEECYRNLMRASIAQHDQVALEAIYNELNTLVEEEQGPDITDWLEPETISLYEEHRRRRRDASS